ncbi:hypothetical protein P3T73_12850 [Kiritimatiellota bacterium B12222]|nr:hypothetical protein P3T73_12850 [Kiritimatiellota bacterium B12222]
MKIFRLIFFLSYLISFSFPLLAMDVEVAERLAVAQRELAIAQAAFLKAEARFEDVQQDAHATTEQVLAMESYVRELKEVVALRRETLVDLREIAGVNEPEVDVTVAEGMAEFENAISQVQEISVPETEQDRLDREFLESLQAFDGMILEYNRKLEDQMDVRMAKGEVEASRQQSAAQEAAELLRSMGIDPGTGEAAGASTGKTSSSETATNSTSAESGTAASTSTSSETEAGHTASSTQGPGPTAQQGSVGSNGGGSAHPPRQDEDIVARQLREAAEKETDPVLREKLWKEYEAYLDGRS